MNMVVDRVLDKYAHAGRDSLIPILQEVQEGEGFLSRKSIVQIGRHLGLSSAKIYGVATFYNQFRFEPQGQFHVQVCRGTACHVRGSVGVLAAVERVLGLKAGETSKDGLFSLEVVACIGACGLAPVMAVNGEFHAAMTPEKVKSIINDYRKQARENDDEG